MSRKINNILVTGATGFVGSHLVKKILEEDYNLTGTKRTTSSLWRIEDVSQEINFYNVDTDRIDIINDIFEDNKVDCVIHLATYYKKFTESPQEIENIIDSNITFPSLILDIATRNKVPYFINTGTFFEYNLNKKKPIKENSEIFPYNTYAATKIGFENILKRYTRKGIKAVTLKLFSPYGERDNEKLVTYLINNILRNNPIEITKGEQRLSFTYVEDIIDAYLKTINFIQDTNSNYETFNIGNNEVNSVKNIVKTLQKIEEKEVKIKWGSKPYSDNEIFYAQCNNKKAREVIKWKPKHSLEEGLSKTLKYYKNKLK